MQKIYREIDQHFVSCISDEIADYLGHLEPWLCQFLSPTGSYYKVVAFASCIDEATLNIMESLPIDYRTPDFIRDNTKRCAIKSIIGILGIKC
jgi:hypothetical protein